MPDAVTTCLTLAQQAQTTREIQNALRAGGVKASKSFRAHVYNTLRRLSDQNGRLRRYSDGDGVCVSGR